jgi:hypothetical protein
VNLKLAKPVAGFVFNSGNLLSKRIYFCLPGLFESSVFAGGFMRGFIARVLVVVLVFCLLGTVNVLREKQNKDFEQFEKCCLETCAKEKTKIFWEETEKLVFNSKKVILLAFLGFQRFFF